MTKNKTGIIICAVVAVLALIAAIIIALSPSKAPEADTMAVRLQTARQFLVELDYDRAIAEFEAIIQIDPMNVEAYLGLAQAYEGKGDIEKAIEVLEEGYSRTGDERIKDILERMKKTSKKYDNNVTSIETSVSSEISEPDEYQNILEYYSNGEIRCVREDEDNGYYLEWHRPNGMLNLKEHYDMDGNLKYIEHDNDGYQYEECEIYEKNDDGFSVINQWGYVYSFNNNGQLVRALFSAYYEDEWIYEYPDENTIISKIVNSESVDQVRFLMFDKRITKYNDDNTWKQEYYFDNNLVGYEICSIDEDWKDHIEKNFFYADGSSNGESLSCSMICTNTSEYLPSNIKNSIENEVFFHSHTIESGIQYADGSIGKQIHEYEQTGNQLSFEEYYDDDMDTGTIYRKIDEGGYKEQTDSLLFPDNPNNNQIYYVRSTGFISNKIVCEEIYGYSNDMNYGHKTVETYKGFSGKSISPHNWYGFRTDSGYFSRCFLRSKEKLECKEEFYSDDNGNWLPTQKNIYDGDDIKSVEKWSYNFRYEITSHEIKDGNDNIISSETWEYDLNGKLVSHETS